MKVLVTGGSGFIGSKIATGVKNGGHEVSIFDVNTKDDIKEGINHIKGDIFDSGHISEILERTDCVIHMVGLPNARKAQERPQLSYDLNVRSTQTILEVMRENDVKNFIFPSSAAIYGITKGASVDESTPINPANTYAYHKWIAEEICRCYSQNYGIKSTILRLFNVYGKEGTGIINILVEKAVRDETISLYGENQLRDFTLIDFIAKAFLSVLDCKRCQNETINVGTGVGRSIKDIVELVKEHYPNIKLERKEYKGVLYDSVADISKLKKLTGFEPDKSIDIMKNTIKEMI
jgi:UDP-glucose 4-epimerase